MKKLIKNIVEKTVAVVHRSITNTKGESYITAAKAQNQEITAQFTNGSIRTSSGDIWFIKPSTAHNGADFVTLATTTA